MTQRNDTQNNVIEPSAAEFHEMDDTAKALCFESMARRALREWGMEEAELQLIKQRENAVFSVRDSAGTRFALRIHRAGYHSDAELVSELRWMSALNDFGVQTPAVIPALDGDLFKSVSTPELPQPCQVDLLAWVSGQAIGSIEDTVGDIESAAQNYHLVGQLVARMHQFTSQWSLPAGFVRHAWDEEGLLGATPWWGRYWELEALNEDQRELLHKTSKQARAELEVYGKDPDRYGLIHADPLPENFLRGDDGDIRVIDFDDGGFGWLMFDFATALFFHLGEPCFDRLLAAMMAGYQEVRELPPEFEQKLPLFLLLRGLTYLGWAHTRKDTDTAREQTPILVECVTALAADYLVVPGTLPTTEI
ncbi:MAG: phosphotransferase [Pseudomonadales bacterium]